MYVCKNMDSINEITAKTEVPLEPSPEVKAKVAAKEENKRKLAEFAACALESKKIKVNPQKELKKIILVKSPLECSSHEQFNSHSKNIKIVRQSRKKRTEHLTHQDVEKFLSDKGG